MRRSIEDSLHDVPGDVKEFVSRYDNERYDAQWDRIFDSNRVSVKRTYWDPCKGTFRHYSYNAQRTTIARPEYRYIAAGVVLAMCATLWSRK